MKAEPRGTLGRTVAALFPTGRSLVGLPLYVALTWPLARLRAGHDAVVLKPHTFIAHFLPSWSIRRNEIARIERARWALRLVPRAGQRPSAFVFVMRAQALGDEMQKTLNLADGSGVVAASWWGWVRTAPARIKAYVVLAFSDALVALALVLLSARAFVAFLVVHAVIGIGVGTAMVIRKTDRDRFQ